VKSIAILLVLGLVGCASAPKPTQSVAISYNRLTELNYTSRDCSSLDANIKYLESQLQARGLLNADPETLNEDDRMYNATARIWIWNLRIGCTNPNRFAKK
jgi:hypothetical protein